jgi:hypothetical protein
MSYKALYKEYIEAVVAEAKAWELAYGCEDKGDAFYEACHEAAYTKVKELKVAVIKHPETTAMTVAISGCCEDDTSHYEIDDAMSVLFGEDYKGDSESGTLFAFTSSAARYNIETGFKIHFPELKFTMTDALNIVNDEDFNVKEDYVNVSIPGAGNWEYAKETLKGL